MGGEVASPTCWWHLVPGAVRDDAELFQQARVKLRVLLAIGSDLGPGGRRPSKVAGSGNTDHFSGDINLPNVCDSHQFVRELEYIIDSKMRMNGCHPAGARPSLVAAAAAA